MLTTTTPTTLTTIMDRRVTGNSTAGCAKKIKVKVKGCLELKSWRAFESSLTTST